MAGRINRVFYLKGRSLCGGKFRELLTGSRAIGGRSGTRTRQHQRSSSSDFTIGRPQPALSLGYGSGVRR
jgi:hypothetical protein